MKVKQVTFEISRVHNLGNYNNVRPSVTILIELTDKDDPVMALEKARNMCQNAIKASIAYAENRPVPADEHEEITEDDLPF